VNPLLTGLNVAVIGGDARQLEIIHRLIELDAKLTLIGFELLENPFLNAAKEKMDDVRFWEIDAIILPAGGTNGKGEVESLFAKEPIFLAEELIGQTPEYCVLFSGIKNEYLKELEKKTGRKVEPVLERDDVAICNSVPTVEGALLLAIQNTDITIHGSKTVIVGFGRVGMTAARAFSALGAKVKVVSGKKEDLARIAEMSLEPVPLAEIGEAVQDADICINTVPALVLTAGVLSKMPSRTFIIDLASKPGGTDFRYAEKRGIKAFLAPSLPGIVAPKTAGKILAGALVELLTDLLIRKEKLNLWNCEENGSDSD